jgi:hypothetical protein
MRFLRSAVLASLAVIALAAAGLAAGAPPARAPAPRAVAPRPVAPAAPIPAPGLFRFTLLNRAYSQPGTAIEPITEGPLTVRLSSPRHKLVLASHSLRLEPGADGLQTAELSVRFYGKGRLVADVDVSGVGRRFEEEVLVPPQTQRLSGRVRIARSGGGYLLTPERLPRELRIAIQSQLGNDIVGLCERLSAVPFSELDCNGLERALSTAVVPLPRAGEGFYLARADLTPEERRQIEGYLAALRGARR